MKNFNKTLTNWLKNEFIPLLIVGTALMVSLAFVYYMMVGTIIILIGGQHIFASSVWSVIIVATFYFLAMLITQLLADNSLETYDKIKPTLVYILLIAVFSYYTVTHNHYILLATCSAFSIIGAITGYCFNHLNNQYQKTCQNKIKTFFRI